MADSRSLVLKYNDVLKLEKDRLKAHPASKLIGVALSSYHAFLDEMLLASDKESESYHRSKFCVLIKYKLETNGSFSIYVDAKFKNGERAHVGCVYNSFQRVGDFYTPIKSAVLRSTTPGNSRVYDALLNRKKFLCEYIRNQCKNKKNMTVGYYNGYPCVMVKISRNTIHKQDGSKVHDASFEEWVNFLISYFVGIVNAKAYQAHINIELIRRSSFGFLQASIAPTSESMRINVGNTPLEYANILVSALNDLDNVLSLIAKDKRKLPKLFKGVFYNTKQYQDYLKDSKYKTTIINNLVHLLWEKVEKAGKTTVQNIMRTAYARDGIAAVVFKQMMSANNTPFAAFVAGLKWSISQIQVKNDKLSFEQGQAITYSAKFAASSTSTDNNFWSCIKAQIDAVAAICKDNALLVAAIADIRASVNSQCINNIYAKLEYLNELLLVYVIDHQSAVKNEDGYGSDSDTEENVDDVKIYSKKLIISNGMRAIWAALKAIEDILNKKYTLYFHNAYYEVRSGINKIIELEKWQVNIVDKKSYAQVLIFDINACNTNGEMESDYSIKDDIDQNIEENKHKILILDTTSATCQDMRTHIQRFKESHARTMFFVASGLKNEQSGDKNSYGTIRIFSKDKSRRNEIYKRIKSHEPPVLSQTAHDLRRLHKSIGMVPTTRAMYKK